MKTQLKWIVALALVFTSLFCASFVFFYHRAQKQLPTPIATAAAGKPLPEAHLIDLADAQLDEQMLRRGKVILVFVTPQCSACEKEGQFLQTVVNQRKDVSFYGVVSYGEKKEALEAANRKFPFKVFYDEGFHLAGKLGIHRVPIKIFLEDGLIRKAWGGATTDAPAKLAFTQWLENLQ